MTRFKKTATFLLTYYIIITTGHIKKKIKNKKNNLRFNNND